MRFEWLRALGPAAIVLAFWMMGCGLSGEAGDSSNAPPTSGEVFESDDPGSGAPGYGTGGATGSGGSSGAAGSGGAGATGGDPGKTIEEADIIQLSGNRLYALSRYSGLSVIDVSKQDELRLLGHHRMEGIPFEMYLRDSVVLAMFSSFSRYVKDAQTQSWSYVQTSAVVALDASDPADIKVIGEFDIPGEISDSRLVDDVMVVVSYENGYCYNCANVPRTTVMSLDVSVPQKPVKVDELTFDDTGYSYGKRSVMATTERMYIAGPEYDQGVNASTVQIVDISDASGKLAKGASFEAAGWIESRWQMDEKDGVLRMISQPPQWSTTNPPVVQTFQVTSATQVTPLGSMDLVLPEPERLRSVRFDGNRAYAITFRQTDPLFTVDLTDPANPQQLGELQMPGWIYHMEPRGDRLFALGFDTSNAEGSLNVSIFDVSDMAAPKMLDRVNFGGDWSQLAEDQDRIHKAFTILDSLGLILVPYSAYNYTGGYEYYCSSSESGIQLIDFTSDDLTKRGVAPSRGRARRAFMQQSRLFAVSDATVETFDIANRDKPVEKAELAISQNVSKVLQVGNKLVRFGADWWTDQATLDVTSLDKVDEPGATTTIELESSTGCWAGWYGVELFADDSRLYLLRDYQGVELRTFDISGDTPVLLGKTVVATASDPYYGGWGYYGYGNAISVGENAVQVGSTIVVARTKVDYGNRNKSYSEEAWFIVIDASDPANAKVTTIKRPDSLGFTGLNVANGRVVSSRWAPSPVNPGKVRFYLDWLDVSNPADPKLLAPVNVPGSLVSMRADGKRAMTVDYKKLVYENLTPQQCHDQHGYNASFQWDGEPGSQMTGTCTTFDHTLRLVDVFGGGAKLKDSMALPENTGYWQLSVGDDRLWIYDYNYYYSGGYDPTTDAQLTVYNGLESGALGSAQVSLPAQDGYVSQRIAQGKKLIVLGGYPARFSVVDADSASAPKITAEAELTLGNYVTDVTLVGDTAVCSLGQYGVEAVPLN